MKKILGLTLLTLLSSMHTLAESSAQAPDLAGCLQIGSSPEGGTQLCLFDNQEFVIAGFGVVKYGTYQVDSQNQRVQFLFQNPQELYIYSTYDPTVQGTKIQFDGFNDHSLSDVFVQFNERGIQPIIGFKTSSCVAYPYIALLKQSLQSINFYIQDERNKTDIRQFHVDLSAKQNKLYVLYMDKSEQLADMYFTYQRKGKEYQFFKTYSTVIDGVRYFEKDTEYYNLQPYEHDDKTFDEFKMFKPLVTRPTGEQDIYFDSVFEIYSRELDKNAYIFDTASHTYHLTDEKKFEILKENMTTSLGYSQQEFNEYIANLSKQELKETLDNSLAFEELYPPILWKYRYHQPKITVMTQFPQMIKQRPVFRQSCQNDMSE